MRILMVEASGRGFLCHYAHALSLALQQAGHTVSLITGNRDELAAWSVPFGKSACLGARRRNWCCLRQQVRQFHPDVVHIQWVDQPLFATLFVRWLQRRGIKTVYTPHNILPHRARWSALPRFRLFYQNVDQVVARDRHITWGLEEILGLPRRQITFLSGSPNLLALPYLYPFTKDRQPDLLPARQTNELRLLFFGHGCKRKGLRQLLSVLATGDWPENIHLVIAGEEVLRGVSKTLLSRARSCLQISLLDQYLPPQQVAALLTSADLMLMPYVKLCKSPLLDITAAFSLPVLRSDRVQGAVFKEGLHGLTIAHDDPLALSTAISVLTADPEQLLQMRTAMVREESVENLMRRLAVGHSTMYQQLLTARSKASSRKFSVLAGEA
ncbi:MAG TPA: glycosyltransferase [Gammaproteobacteria bacterium]|nr:glycosyltransferase [Gammaproteobacteria bacterium]